MSYLKIHNLLILILVLCFSGATDALADTKKWHNFWSKKHVMHGEIKGYQPYLEKNQHEQVPQWDHKEWYAEDWIAQAENGGDELIQGFYDGDILRDQTSRKFGQDLEIYPILVVGPNFYRLSGYDKRRVTFIVDQVHGITKSKPDGFFMLHDWHTKLPIGVFDKNGLRLN